MKPERAAPSNEKTKREVTVPSWVAPLVVFLGIGFIFTSISQLGVLVDHARYRSLFQHWPESLAHLRYLISWGASLLGLVVGVGLFFHKDFFRKSGVFLAWLSIAGVFGKYSHEGFVQYIGLLSEQMATRGAPFSPGSVIQYAQAWNVKWLTASSLAWGCIIFIMILDIIPALIVIFLMTRASVKARFR